MARKPTPTLTAAELPVMDVLWGLGSGTARDVVERLPRELAYNTVLTTLRILERKRYVSHRQEGRTFLWRPRVARDEARRSAVRDLVGRFFGGQPEELVLNLLEDEALDAGERARLKALLDGAEDEP